MLGRFETWRPSVAHRLGERQPLSARRSYRRIRAAMGLCSAASSVSASLFVALLCTFLHRAGGDIAGALSWRAVSTCCGRFQRQVGFRPAHTKCLSHPRVPVSFSCLPSSVGRVVCLCPKRCSLARFAVSTCGGVWFAPAENGLLLRFITVCQKKSNVATDLTLQGSQPV